MPGTGLEPVTRGFSALAHSEGKTRSRLLAIGFILSQLCGTLRTVVYSLSIPMLEIFSTVAFIVFLLLAYYLYREIQKQKVKRSRSPRHTSPSTDPALSSLQRKAYGMAAGDKAAVERLVAYNRSLNPGRSLKWVWEKTILDMERDRR